MTVFDDNIHFPSEMEEQFKKQDQKISETVGMATNLQSQIQERFQQIEKKLQDRNRRMDSFMEDIDNKFATILQVLNGDKEFIIDERQLFDKSPLMLTSDYGVRKEVKYPMGNQEIKFKDYILELEKWNTKELCKEEVQIEVDQISSLSKSTKTPSEDDQSYKEAWGKQFSLNYTVIDSQDYLTNSKEMGHGLFTKWQRMENQQDDTIEECLDEKVNFMSSSVRSIKKKIGLHFLAADNYFVNCDDEEVFIEDSCNELQNMKLVCANSLKLDGHMGTTNLVDVDENSLQAALVLYRILILKIGIMKPSFKLVNGKIRFHSMAGYCYAINVDNEEAFIVCHQFISMENEQTVTCLMIWDIIVWFFIAVYSIHPHKFCLVLDMLEKEKHIQKNQKQNAWMIASMLFSNLYQHLILNW